MSKAEDKAMQYCCAKCVHDKFGCSMKVLHNGRDCIKCGNYIKGYEQAEKDLELGWEDIEKVCLIAREVHQFRGFWSESVYQEILKRFKDYKERKEK